MTGIYKSISKKEALELVDKNRDNPDFQVLDVRTPEELAGGVIGEPINIDIYNPDFTSKLDALEKNKTYLIYCRSGSRSKSALGIMRQLGFQNVWEMDNGILG